MSTHKNKEESLEILNSFIEGKKTFALQYQDKVIGSLGIEKYNEEILPELDKYKAREIGFVLSKDYWGKGLMKQAVDVVIDYLFNEINLDVIVCCHSKNNNQSKRLQEKCGFKPFKEYHYDTFAKKNVESIANLYWKKDYQKL